MRTRLGSSIGLIVAGMVILLVFSGCCALKACSSGKGESCTTGKCAAPGAVESEAKEAEIDTAALKTLIASGAPLTILDARSGKYDDGRRIPGAGSLNPLASEEAVAKAIPSKDALVVTYCSNLKCPASRMLAKRLHKLGYRNILEYPYGIEGWVEEGNEVEKAAGK